jgi:hypothetical protein
MRGHITLPPPPLWVSRDLSRLSMFGRAVPEQDIVLVAAYPADILTPNLSFVIFKEWPSPKVADHADAMAAEGLVTADDVAHWR